MDPLDQVKIAFAPGQLAILNLCLAFLMFGVALDLSLDAFRKLANKPLGPVLGLVSQWLVLPLLTIGLIFLLRPSPSMSLGMLLVSACPGGNVSNFMVHYAGANAALSVTLTTISSLSCVLVTPLYFAFLAPVLPGTATLVQTIQVNPGDMIFTVVQLVLVPLLLGMVVYAKFPSFAKKIRRPVRVLSVIIFLGIIIVALYMNVDNLAQYLKWVFLIVLLHNGFALLAGYMVAKAGKLGQNDARAISLETGIQNSGLALILIFNFFDGLGGMAIVAAWWGIWHLISGMAIAVFWRSRGMYDNN